jgi:hypothetical protein
MLAPLAPGTTVGPEERRLREEEALRLIDRSILIGQEAVREAGALKARAFAIAPWLMDDAADLRDRPVLADDGIRS